MNQAQLDQLYETKRKSAIGAFLLAFLFGPLGMFIVSTTAGVISLLITVAIGAVTVGVGALLLWPIFMILAPMMTSSVNAKIKTELQLTFGQSTV